MVKYVDKRDGSRTVIGKTGIVGNLPSSKALGAGNEDNLTAPVSTDSPEPSTDAIDSLIKDVDHFHESFAGLTAPSTTVALAEDPPEPVVKPISDFPEETVTAAQQVGKSFGMQKSVSEGMLQQAESVIPHYDGEEYDFLSADDSADFIVSCVSYREGDKSSEELVQSVRDGKLILTRRDLACLAGVRDLIAESQSRDALDYAGDDAWIPSTEQRHCTLCGQFIGLRTSHSNCKESHYGTSRDLPANIASALEAAGKTDLGEANGSLFADGKDRDIATSLVWRGDDMAGKYVPSVITISGLPEEEMLDLYYGGASHTFDKRRRRGAGFAASKSVILLSYAKKPMFSSASLPLPPSIRRAFVEAPPLNERVESYPGSQVEMIASIIEPPLQKHELAHLLETGGPSVAKALLNVKSARADVKELIENYPSDGAAGLAYTGGLDEDTLRSMASSPDPLVQREAAIAPNLPPEALQSLLTSPHRDVRMALVDASYGFHSGFETQIRERKNLADHLGIQVSATSSGQPHYNLSGLSSALDRNPNLLPALLNDPDDSVAAQAILENPIGRATFKALGEVTSRRRLETLRRHLSEKRDDTNRIVSNIRSSGLPASSSYRHSIVAGKIGQCLELIDRRLGK